MTALGAGAWGLGASLVLASGLWLVSLARADVSIVDVFWGPLLALQGWVHRMAAPDPGPLSDVALGLATLWALRLAWHLGRRSRGRGEDPRYAAMRRAGGRGWPVRALATVFWLQAVLAWAIAWPLAAAARSAAGMGVWGWLAAVLALGGLVFEAVADAQLTRFKTAGESGVMDRGLWRFSRHPNYFGDAVFWWGLYGLAVVAGAGWTAFAPVLMTALLIRVSGVPLLEARLRETRPGWADYARRTPAFVPWFPRSAP